MGRSCELFHTGSQGSLHLPFLTKKQLDWWKKAVYLLGFENQSISFTSLKLSFASF